MSEAAVVSQPVTQMIINPSAADPLAGVVKELPKPETKPNESQPSQPQGEPEKIAAQTKDPVSRGFSALARKDKELRHRYAQIKQEQQRMAKLQSQIQEKESQLSQFQQLKNQNPLEAMKALGLSYEDVTNFVLSGQTKPTAELEIQNIKEQMSRYLEQQQAKEQHLAQLQARAAQQEVVETVAQYKSKVAQVAQSHPEFELVSIHGDDAYDLVLETQKAEFAKKGRILPLEKAIARVEEYLTEDAKKVQGAKKFQNGGQIQQRPATTAQVANSHAMERAMNTLSGPRPTLTNAMSGSTAPSLLPAKTENDRLARAMAALDRK